ncbi:hypothetical protein TrST_g6810 [Triparma strigata]|uniref:Uncharacterized protein n=1 Tax=Triparma strigata TaxID=1606541 RepID=A0A9W7E7Z1_9STRA|nr:hypothetical protein TrST_g6810 [Triparma strigata]
MNNVDGIKEKNDNSESENNDSSGVSAAAARSTARMALKSGLKSGAVKTGTTTVAKAGVKAGAKQMAKSGATQAAKKSAVKIVQKAGVGKLPVKTIAKVADRGATLGDVADSLSVDSVKSEFKISGFSGAFRVLARGAMEFAKVTGLGIVAWEGYDFLLREWSEKSPPPIPVHFGAGAIAGSAHGSMSFALDRFAGNRVLPHYRVLHHGLSHAVLFGSYEYIKTGIENNVTHKLDNNENDEIGAEHAIGIGVAGGVAGVLSQVASSLVEPLEVKVTGSRPAIINRIEFATLRSAFLPGALGFMAFEYSKDFLMK